MMHRLVRGALAVPPFAPLMPALVLALAACSGPAPDASTSTEVTRTTHPELGVPLITSGAGLAERDLGWTVSAEPELVLGVVDGGPDAELFSQISGAKQRRDGTLFVVERDFGEVRVFDRDGRHLRTLGRQGDGPGEFRSPWMVPTPDHFEVLVWDRGHRRMVRVDGALELGGPRSVGRSLGNVLGTIGDTVMTHRTVLMMTQEEGRVDSPAWYYAVRPAGDAVTIDSLADPWYVEMGESSSGEPIPYLDVLALAARPTHAMHFNALLVVDGADPRIRWYGPDGSLQRIVEADLPPRPATRDDMLEFGRNQLRARDVEVTDEYLDRYRKMPLPEHLAAFDELVVDTDGHLWARSYRLDHTQPTNRWLIFAPGGELLGHVDLPDLDDIYQIGPDFVLGRVIDDLRVQRVVRYGLTR